MDLAALKNLDIKDLLNKIKGAGAGNILQDKKILIKFGIGFGSILIFLIIYYVFVSPDLLENKLIVKKGDVITSSILGESDLNLKSINLKIKSLLRETRDEIKSKGSQVGEIKTNGNFVKKIRDFLQENQNIKFKLEVVSLRDSKTIEPIVVEINILKIAS